ncbi:MAG: hypothetical protein J0L53_14390 [Spirochaetes bacterium]|nr:hypothetical protein [Spirochaetota bacterium]
MKNLAITVIAALLGCAQSTVVFDPVQNKAPVASTSPTQGTLTLSINLTAQGANHQNQGFSAFLVQNGNLVAALMQGTASTNGSGQATAVLNSVDASRCMIASTPATLQNGSYDLYFAINYNGQTALTVFTTCGAPGFLASIPNNLYALRGQVTISGNTTYSINDSNVSLGKSHTMQLSGTTPGTRAFTCWLTDPSATTNIGNHILSGFAGTTDGSGNATSTTLSGVTPLMATGTYKYFCYLNANGNGTTGDSGDKMASGYATVTGASMTVVSGASFSLIP